MKSINTAATWETRIYSFKENKDVPGMGKGI